MVVVRVKQEVRVAPRFWVKYWVQVAALVALGVKAVFAFFPAQAVGVVVEPAFLFGQMLLQIVLNNQLINCR